MDCPCGFEHDAVVPATVAPRVRRLAATFAELLDAGSVDVRRRPAPDVWSPLEYACHVRDVLLTLRERLILALWRDVPTFTPMGRDERVVFDRYAEQAPADVARQLVDAATMFAFVFEGLSDEQLARRCVYGFPQAEERTLAWVGAQAVHEAAHHLADAGG